MILDERNEFADATSVAAAASTALIGDVIDLGATTNYIGEGEPLYLVIQTDTEIITGGNAGTILFSLASDAQAAIATNGTATVHFTTNSIVTDGTDANGAQCKAGATIAAVALPQGAYERYLGILCTVGTTEVTAGKINAFLTHDVAKYRAFADGI